ncbi:MAG: cysteine desulfurase family protein [Chloroflexota bacterium]|nr:cysteine desulfurase family protein [Chloroflexota bacterium]MDE2919823.1 cysteine desulfurase family protein [Chloroflexota bacterium]
MTQAAHSRIYLDHAATTPLDPAVFEAMRPYLWSEAGNPSSVHAAGRRAREAVDTAREQVASVLGCKPGEVIFTSGGTEADNLAVIGLALAETGRGRHIVTTAIEHHAVLFAARSLRACGFEVTELAVDQAGRVDPADVETAVRPDTTLVSIGLANNEIGTIQEVPTLARIGHAAGARLHTDAVQAAGQLDINVDRLGVDLLSLSAHKLYGPKGVGALYVREGVNVERRAFGGAQERDRRAGTENVPAIVGLGEAILRAEAERDQRTAHMRSLSVALVDRVTDRCSKVRVTGDPERRLPAFAPFAFADIDAESLLIRLDLEGIAVSTGAACTSGSLEPSHVIEALGLPEGFRRGSLRCTVGRGTTLDEVTRAGEAIARHVRTLRAVAAASGVV